MLHRGEDLPTGIEKIELIHGIHPLRCKPEGTFPTVLGAIYRACVFQAPVERRQAQLPRRLMLLPRVTHFIVMRVMLDRTRIHECPRPVMGTEPTHIQGPEIKRGCALHNPFRNHLSGATASRYPIEEPSRKHQVFKIRLPAHDEISIRGIRNRAIDHLPDTNVVQNRCHLPSQLCKRQETIKIFWQQLAYELIRNFWIAKRQCALLIPAYHKTTTHIRFVIDQPFGIPQRRIMPDFIAGGFCDNVLMFNRTRRHADTQFSADFTAPHAGGKYDVLCLIFAGGCFYMRDPTAMNCEIGHLDTLPDIGPLSARRAGDGLT